MGLCFLPSPYPNTESIKYYEYTVANMDPISTGVGEVLLESLVVGMGCLLSQSLREHLWSCTRLQGPQWLCLAMASTSYRLDQFLLATSCHHYSLPLLHICLIGDRNKYLLEMSPRNGIAGRTSRTGTSLQRWSQQSSVPSARLVAGFSRGKLGRMQLPALSALLGFLYA